ncbi:hypothetical protein RE628_17640 [Paenibacillus sp. D2_2]|uniref:hypothetical protein n=1 Tax=Paenibacillus sp. D2_2 TaxID=3073092 RepID=UPI002815978C|nr:hypothetical protein [Paenibacillus sp. D2_2]WMT39275.1 hypothetical protein RE628_17640 [Paenibacillus sp. D2_2]
MDKFSGYNQEPFTDEEYDCLVFALESNILFDTVGQKFLAPLKAVPKVNELELTGEETEEELVNKQCENERLVQERNDNIKAVLLTLFKDSIIRDIRIRFGA